MRAKQWQIIRSVSVFVLLFAAQTAAFFVMLPGMGVQLTPVLPAMCLTVSLLLACTSLFALRRFGDDALMSYLDAASLTLLMVAAALSLFIKGAQPSAMGEAVSAYSLYALICIPIPLMWIRRRRGWFSRVPRLIWLAWLTAETAAAALMLALGAMEWALAVRVSAWLLLAGLGADMVWESLCRSEPVEPEAPQKDAAPDKLMGGDELTGLLGRAAFATELNELLANGSPDTRHAVMMIDIDGFKAVNDTFGHGFGDKVLVDIAGDLRSIQRNDDLIARLGGDEYIICLKGIPAERGFLLRRCSVIRRMLSKSFGDEVAISASIGVALFPEHGADFETLYRRADQALYQAKEAGRDRCVIFGDGSDGSADGDAAGETQPAFREAEPPQRHTILVADDQRMNRVILAEIFKDTYRVLEAANGKEALDILKNEQENVSVLVLDLLMPVMNGLELLESMRDDALLQTIPVVVVSAANEEEYSTKAIGLGALDFVTKPIDQTLIRLRVRNAIVRRESERLRTQNRELLVQRANEARHQKQLRYVAEHDAVTHIYNKSAFYRRTRAMLNSDPGREYCIICFDILRFRAVNDIFGHDEGDRLLRYVAVQLQNLAGESGTCSRVSVDLFAVCVPYDEARVQELMSRMSQSLKNYELSFEVQLWFGIFRIDDPSLPINQMQDRAVMAERTVKGSYIKSFAYYDDSMSAKLVEEQSVINDMAQALANNEFIVYYQTKCRLDTGGIVGAEALVRWQHPRRGLLSPGLFVPIFERNGFIMRLDEYIWERVCAFLGERLKKDPSDQLCVSVNISRANLYNPNLCATLDRLCKQYGVPNSHMEVEITESAYVENAQLLLDLTAQLHGLGFTVEMDDFGSGYSSLNMLKEIPVDVLKLDMRFLYGIQNDARGGSILSSIISMARKLDMDVIAEGVENEEQARFLAGIGCRQAQGYYYDRPMPQESFERRLMHERQQEARLHDFDSARLYLSKLLCSAVLAKVCGDRLELLCANEYYYRMMQISEENFDRRDRRMSERIGATDMGRLMDAMGQARREGRACRCDYVQQDLRNRYHLLNASVTFVTEMEDGPLFVVSMTDVHQRLDTPGENH